MPAAVRADSSADAAAALRASVPTAAFVSDERGASSALERGAAPSGHAGNSAAEIEYSQPLSETVASATEVDGSVPLIVAEVARTVRRVP